MIDDLKKFLKENYNIEKVDLSLDFKKDLGLSSFDFVNLMFLLEKKYNITIEEENFRSIVTVGDLITYIEKKER